MKNVTVFALASVLLVISIAGVAYAHAGETTSNQGWNMGGVMSGDFEEMNEMHEYVTQGLDPLVKEQMNNVHESCGGRGRG